MKRFLKILTIVLASMLAFILLLSVSAKLFEDNIAKVALKQVSKNIKTPIEIGSVNFNLVRGFPKSTIEFNNLWLKSPDQNTSDTIAGIKHLYVSINSRAAINGKYEVEKMEIDGLALNYSINKDSISNIDFLMNLLTESDTLTQEEEKEDLVPDSTILYFNLHQLLLKNISCSYFDGTSNTGAKVMVPEIILKGNIMGDDYTAETNGNVLITNVSFGDYNLELMQKASLDFHLNYLSDTVQINNFIFQTDGIEINAMGLATMGENITMDAAINGGKIDLGELSKYIPQKMLTEFGLVAAQGVLSFSTKITGEYNDSIMPRVDADFTFKDGAIKTTDYPEIKHLSFAGKASNGILRNNVTTSLDLTSLKVGTQSSTVNFSAQILNINQPVYKIKTNGSVLIDEFTAFIPADILESISGRLTWELGSSGAMPQEIGDDFPDYLMARTWANISVHKLNTTIDSSLSIKNFSTDFAYKPHHFSIQNLEIGVPNYDVTLENTSADITVNGSLTDVDNMTCAINDLHLEFDNNTLDLKASVSNLTNPDYAFDGTINVNLADLQKFAPDTLINAMKGEAKAHIISQGHIDLDSIATQATTLAFENTAITLDCKNIDVAMTDTLINITDLNLAMEMKPDTISINQFSGDYKGLTFAVNNTQIINAYNTIILNKPEQLAVITSLALGDVDYALFEPFMVEDPTNNAEGNDSIKIETDSSITNYTMDIKGDIAINSLKIEDYEIDTSLTINRLFLDNFSTKFRVTDSTYIADSLQFYAFGGYTNTSVRYDIKPDGKAVAAIRNHIDGMDFKQVLYDMDNFGQSDLTNENISGQLLSDINAEVTIIGDSVYMDLIKLKGTFELSNGGVYDFEPAESLSKFTGIKELDNIQFQTLKTQLFVHKGAAYIPKTDVISTAIDISAFGMQTFGEDYEYHLELHLGDVLTGKSENLMKRQAKASKDADEEVNRNGVNLKTYSLEGKTKTGFDTKKAQRRMSNKITSKNGVLSMVFYPELVDFKTDW